MNSLAISVALFILHINVVVAGRRAILCDMLKSKTPTGTEYRTSTWVVSFHHNPIIQTSKCLFSFMPHKHMKVCEFNCCLALQMEVANAAREDDECNEKEKHREEKKDTEKSSDINPITQRRREKKVKRRSSGRGAYLIADHYVVVCHFQLLQPSTSWAQSSTPRPHRPRPPRLSTT